MEDPFLAGFGVECVVVFIAGAIHLADDQGVGGDFLGFGERIVVFVFGDLLSIFDGEFDLVCMFDCLHDMGDPAGAAAHIRSCLKPDGTLMVVEPIAEDAIQDNINPVGRLYYAVLRCARPKRTGEHPAQSRVRVDA